MDKTNLTEMAAFFPAHLSATVPGQRAVAVPYLQPGETMQQAIKRREEVAARIQRKNAERAA